MSDRETRKYLGNGYGRLHRTFLGIEKKQEIGWNPKPEDLVPEYKAMRYFKELGNPKCECGKRFVERSLVIKKRDGTLLCPECYQLEVQSVAIVDEVERSLRER